MRTCLLIDRERGNADRGAPGGQVGHFVDQPLQFRATPAIVFELQDHTQMLGQAAQILEVLGDDLRGAVVVPHNGPDPIADAVVGQSNADVEREDGVDDGEDEQVELRAKKPANP